MSHLPHPDNVSRARVRADVPATARRERRIHLHRRNARRLGLAFWSNVLLGLAWTAMLPVTLISGLKTSVPFVAAISIYALMVGHMSSALAALAGKGAHEAAETLHSADEPPGP